MSNTKLRNAADARKRAFAEYVAAGKSGTEAARLAGYSGTDASLGVTASRLLKNAMVRELIEQAVAKASKGRILTATERRELLSEFAKPSDPREPVDIRDRIAAVKELNAMDGLHVKQVQHSGPGGQPIGAVLATIPEDEIRKRLAELAKRKTK